MRPRGLVLVTGPTGSGKTTTLAAMIDYINDNFDHHIITIEDPIEFYHYAQEVDGQPARDRRRRAQLRRGHPPRAASRPRRDPGRRNARPGDDRGGHHRGRNRPPRLRHPAHHRRPGHGQPHHRRLPTNQQEQIRTQLSVAIIGILSQALLPKIGGGRVAAYEMLVVTPAIANLIRENKTFRITSAIQTGQKLGMQLLDDHLFRSGRRRHRREEGDPPEGQHRPTSWPPRSPRPSGECSKDEEEAKGDEPRTETASRYRRCN